MLTEKMVISNILEYYKNLPCLWDVSHISYRHKESRIEAWRVLVDKWKDIDPNANPDLVKKKLENMRTTFIREWRKVDLSKVRTSDHSNVYKPSLWYYNNMKFLIKVLSPKHNNAESEDENSASDDASFRVSPQFLKLKRSESASDNSDSDNTPTIRIRRSEDSERKSNSTLDAAKSDSGHTVWVSEKEVKLRNVAKRRKTDATKRPVVYDYTQESASRAADRAVETIGTAYSHQLQEMSKLQRCIAEKLISEVMFYGKLDLLTVNSTILLSKNDDTE